MLDTDEASAPARAACDRAPRVPTLENDDLFFHSFCTVMRPSQPCLVTILTVVYYIRVPVVFSRHPCLVPVYSLCCSRCSL